VASSLQSHCHISKHYLARLSFGIGVIGLIMGSVMACDCWGWFACTGLFFIYLLQHGSRLLKVFSVILLLLSIFTAVVQFREEVDLDATLQKLKQRH